MFGVRRSMLGVRRFSAKLINVESAELTKGRRAGLRITIARHLGADEAMARRASHDVDGDCRHPALHRSRVGDRNFLWFHTAVSAQDVVVDRSGLGLPLQQNRSCDCGDGARRRYLGDARDLSCRVSIGVLELASPASSACAFSSIWTARLYALACIFTGRLAHVLARVCWFAVSCDSFGDRYLFSYALAD